MKHHAPAELPEKPDGWTKRLSIHLNFGQEGGSACYSVHDPEGREMVITYQYDTRKSEPARVAIGKKKAKPAFEPAPTGFHVPSVDSDVFPSWTALRAAWPGIVAKLATGGTS